MNPFRRTIGLAAALVACLALTAQLRAQSAQAAIDPARFPKNTIFYLLWRGAPPPAARSANSLYSLWDDAGFAPARNALFDSFMSESRKSGDPKSQITREEISEFTVLLENPMAIGFVSDPAKNNSASASASDTAKKPDAAHKWNGFFFIYDRTGKEALLQKALLRFRASEKFPPKITPTTIAGFPATKVEHKNETDYWVESGKYVITSGEVSVVQQILTRFNSGASSQASLISPDQSAELEKIVARTTPGAPPMSLGGVPAFKEASPVLGNGGILEFFVNISDVVKLAGDAPGPQGIRPSAVLDSIKMSSVHSFSGRVFLDGAKTRFQAGVLGDTTSGGIFDIWDAGQAKPASTAYITPNAVSYRETQLNLPGVYALAMQIAKPFLPKGSDEDRKNMIDAASLVKLGMPVSDALNSLTGELGYLQTDSSFDFGKNTFFIGVRNRENALKLLRHAFIDEISSDTDEAGVTYLALDLSKPAEGQKPTAGNKFYLAVAKDMILVVGNRETLRAPLAQKASPAAANQLTPFLSSHNDGHAMLNGLSFTDFQKFDWQSLKNLPGRNKATGASVLLGFAPDKTAPAPEKSWLEEIDPKVFSRHLHLSFGYTWKDANGLHIDGWID
jgi:hypothetical protein